MVAHTHYNKYKTMKEIYKHFLLSQLNDLSDNKCFNSSGHFEKNLAGLPKNLTRPNENHSS